jgi:hypothetical protein
LAGKNLPGIGLAVSLEETSVPQLVDIVDAIKEICAEVP